MLLRTLGASLLVNILVGKGAIARSNRGQINEKGRRINRAGKGYVRAGYGRSSKKNVFLMPPHPLTNFELQKYYQNKPRFNGVYSRDNVSVEIKDGKYVINLDEYSDIGTHLCKQ